MSKIHGMIALALLLMLLSSCDDAGTVGTESAAPVDSHSENSTYTADSVDSEADTTGPVSEMPPEEHEEYLENALKWINMLEEPEKVILTPEEISEFNRSIRRRTETVVDISEYGEKVTQEEVLALLHRDTEYLREAYDRYGNRIDGKTYDAIMNNCALEPEEEFTPWRALVSSRANLRLIPWDSPLYSSPGSEYDMLQLTELHIGMPLWVLHASEDGKFLFVKAYHYVGWVSADDVAITENEDVWLYYVKPDKFAVVTSPLVRIGGGKYDMGARLPLLEKGEDEYTVVVPLRDAGGMLKLASASVSSSYVSDGYLSFTYAALLNQAFKYEGTMYGWGGVNDGVDCSSFVGNVFRTFGFMFPRDTGEQKHSVGNAVSTENMQESQIAELLRKSEVPTVVYYPGHTMIYIGEHDGKFAFIHSPQIGEAVCVTEKESLAGITYVNMIG